MQKHKQLNSKYYADKDLAFKPAKFALVFSALAIIPLISFATTNTETPDNTGTDQQDTVYQSLSEQFSAVLRQKAALALAQNNTFDLTNNTNAPSVNAMTARYTSKAEQALISLYTQGATNSEAAISEQQFANIWHYITDNDLIDLEKFGYKENINPGILDECTAKTPPSPSDSMMKKYQNSQEINLCMSNELNQGSHVAVGIAMMFSVVLLLASSPERFSCDFNFIGDKKSRRKRAQKKEQNRLPVKRLRPTKYGLH